MNTWLNTLYRRMKWDRESWKRLLSVVKGFCEGGILSSLMLCTITMYNTAYALNIGSEAPDFYANSTSGEIHFHDQLEGRYSILFSHPQDFTPVCTTEIGALAKRIGDFQRRKTSLYVLSINTVDEHNRWVSDINRFLGRESDERLPFAVIGNSPGFDSVIDIARQYDMLPGDLGETRDPDVQKEGLGSAKDNATVRTVFIIGPDKRVRLTMSYPMTTGRNVDEILRTLDAIQFSDRTGLATPVDWQPGKPGIVPPGMSDAEAMEKYSGVVKVNDYLRYANNLKS